MSYLTPSLKAVVSSYTSKPTKSRNSWDRWQYHVIDLAMRMHFALHDESLPFDEVRDSYCYLYLDTRKPKGKYTFTCPSGFTHTTSHPVYYVGQGRGNRSQSHLRAALRKEAGYKAHSNNLPKINTTQSIIRETGDIPTIVVMKGRLTRLLACAFEVDLIAGIGRRDLGKGPLTNMTDGGEGTVGYLFTEKDRKRMRSAQRRRFLQETEEQKIVRVNKAKSTKKARPEVEAERVRKIAEFNRQDDVRAAKSEGTKRQWAVEGYAEKRNAAQRKTWATKSEEEKQEHARRSGAASRRVWASRSDKERARLGAIAAERARAKARPFVWHFSETRKVRVKNTPIGVFSKEHGLNQNTVSLVLRGLRESYKGMKGYYVS